MPDGPEWFAPKRHGFGSGRPITWQGWAITIAFIIAALAICLMLRDRSVIMLAALAPIVLVHIFITMRTTRGGWRWRWGRRHSE